MKKPLQILFAEDNPDDVDMTLAELRRSGFDPDWHRVETEEEYLNRLSLDVLRKRTARRNSMTPVCLSRTTVLGRVLFTQDIGFKARAEDWQREGRPFAGLVFGHQLHGSIGQYVRDLELIAKATEPEEWIGRV